MYEGKITCDENLERDLLVCSIGNLLVGCLVLLDEAIVRKRCGGQCEFQFEYWLLGIVEGLDNLGV